MTNREKLAQEIAAMTDAQLGAALENFNMNSSINDMVCRDCPHNSGDGLTCALELEDPERCPETADWLAWPCRRDPLLSPVTGVGP